MLPVSANTHGTQAGNLLDKKLKIKSTQTKRVVFQKKTFIPELIFCQMFSILRVLTPI